MMIKMNNLFAKTTDDNVLTVLPDRNGLPISHVKSLTPVNSGLAP